MRLDYPSMAATLDAIENATSPLEKPRVRRLPAHLEAYKFKAGSVRPGPGRPKGCKNAQTVLLQSAPRLARSYVKEGTKGNAAVLVDARKWILPVEEDVVHSAERVVIFIGQGELPRPLTVAEAPAASLPTSVQPPVTVESTDRKP